MLIIEQFAKNVVARYHETPHRPHRLHQPRIQVLDIGT